MTSAAQQEWLCRDHRLILGGRAKIMGVVNVTPDSFSDGGLYRDPEAAIAHGLMLVEQGADLLDIGGESSRPGALPVSGDEELKRILPVIKGLASQTTIPLSIDTTKAGVARAGLEAGAHIVNDISGLQADPGMVSVCRDAQAGIVVMHRQGNSKTMQDKPQYENCLVEVKGYLEQRTNALLKEGIAPACIALDPGIGFGKSLQHNLSLLRGIPELRQLGFPLLIGLSRKRMLGELTGRAADERLAGSLAGLAYSIQQGTEIIRVHDVQESCDVAHILAILGEDEF